MAPQVSKLFFLDSTKRNEFLRSHDSEFVGNIHPIESHIVIAAILVWAVAAGLRLYWIQSDTDDDLARNKRR